MESPDLKSPPPDDAALETWLRANSSLPPLPDGGFSRRVLATLPRPARRHQARRSWLCLAGVMLGGAIALAGVLGSGDAAADDLFVSLNHPLATPPALNALALALCSVWYAFRHRVRVRLLPRW